MCLIQLQWWEECETNWEAHIDNEKYRVWLLEKLRQTDEDGRVNDDWREWKQGVYTVHAQTAAVFYLLLGTHTNTLSHRTVDIQCTATNIC